MKQKKETIVYVLLWQYYEACEIAGVFTTKRQATIAKKRLVGGASYSIYEVPINKLGQYS